MQCLGRTKLLHRCKNKGNAVKYGFCKSHKFQSIIFIFSVLSMISVLLGFYKDIKTMFTPIEKNENYITAINNISNAKLEIDDKNYSKAITLLDKAENLLILLDIKEDIINAELNLIYSTAYLGLGENDTAMHYNGTSLEMYRKNNDTLSDDYILTQNIKSIIELELGNFEEAELGFLKTLEWHKKNSSDKSTLVNDMILLMQVYIAQQKLDNVIQLHEEIVQVLNESYDEIDNGTRFYYYSSCVRLLNELQVYEKAVPLVKDMIYYGSIDLGNNAYELGKVYLEAGTAYEGIEDIEKALEYYNLGLDKIKNLEGINSPYLSTFYERIASIYSRKGLEELAEINYDTSLRLSKLNFGENSREYGTIVCNLAFHYFEMNKYKLALNELKKCEDIFIRHGDSNSLEMIQKFKDSINVVINKRRN